MTEHASKQPDRKSLLRRIGSMGQISGIRPIAYRGGKADGIKAFQVTNGTGLEFTALESKSLDIVQMTYKGINLNFSPKAGIVSPALADMAGTEYMGSISGGMLYTCGLQNIGPASMNDGFNEPFHGRLKNTPAEQTSVSCGWEDGEYVLRLSGEMREAAIFRENLVLSRTLETAYGAKSVRVVDRAENQGFEERQLMLLYHINVGYPILDEGARLRLASREVTSRDPISESGIGAFDELTGPVDGFTEHVYLVRTKTDRDGRTAAAVINDRLGLGVYVKYDARQLPNLVEWKSMRSGDYALGMMPSTGFVMGRQYEEEHGTLRKIDSFETLTFELEIGVLEGAEEIAAFDAYIDSLH